MSAIYGICYPCERNEAVELSLSRAGKWNLAYGEYKTESFQNPCTGLGIAMDHITNAPCPEYAILTNGNLKAVIDCILYNRTELCEKYSLSSALSDEELLFSLVQQEGFDALSYVNGDFAGAVINLSDGTITLFRDHMGVRPLFYYCSETFLGFSTDMRGLLSMEDVPGEADPEYIYRIVNGYDESDYTRTEVKDVFSLKPASYMVIRPAEGKLHCEEHVYWKLGTKKIRLKNRKGYYARMRELITESVRRRIAVFPGVIGGELSGGLDSGVIDILINRLGREGVFYSWSFGFDDIPPVEGDERLVIKDICDQENITCHYGAKTMDLSDTSNIGKAHTRIGLPYDPTVEAYQNFALPLYINTLIVCETAQFMKEHGSKVVFSGHGGDEGVSHRCTDLELFYHREYLHFLRQIWLENEGKKHRAYKTLRRFAHAVKHREEFYNRTFQIGKQAPFILQDAFRERFKDSKMPVLTFGFDVVSYMYSGNTQNRPMVTALLGAYSGARYIFPYLDPEVVDYSVSIPRWLYLNGKQNRYIFRQAFKDIMPPSLYACTAKNNPSTLNLDQTKEDWFERYCPFRDYVVRTLDREYWKDILDFDVVDRWAHSAKPDQTTLKDFVNTGVMLTSCLQLQLMVQKSKSV